MATTYTKIQVFYNMTNTPTYVNPDTWGDVLGSGIPPVGWAGTFYTAPGVAAIVPVLVPPIGLLDLIHDEDTMNPRIRITLYFIGKPQAVDLDSMISILSTGGQDGATDLASFCTGGTVFFDHVELSVFNNPV